MDKRIVFSLDPGIVKIGISVISDKKLIDWGVLGEEKIHPKEFNKRMNANMIDLIPTFAAFLDDHKVTHVAWELVPGKPMSSKTLIESTVAVLKVLTFQHNLWYTEYSALAWHNILLQNPKASKIDVKEWVLAQYPEVSPKLSFDAYDAIAIGHVALTETKWSKPYFKKRENEDS